MFSHNAVPEVKACIRVTGLLHAVVALYLHIYNFFILSMGDPVEEYTNRLQNQVRFSFKPFVAFIKKQTVYIVRLGSGVFLM